MNFSGNIPSDSLNKTGEIMKEDLLNDEFFRSGPKLPDIPSAHELWQPPEPVPAEILKTFPNEESIPMFLKLVMKGEVPDTPEVRAQIRGFVNYRRKIMWEEWRVGQS